MNPELALLIVLKAELTPSQTDSFIDHVLAGRTIQSVAHEYGVSHSAVSIHVRGARKKMRRVIEAEMALAAAA